MRILAKPEALDVISEDYCTQVGGGLYICGVDYLLVKGYVLGSIADYVFGFVGDSVPILNVECSRHIMYYGFPEIFDDPKLYVEGWRRGEADGVIIMYSCIEDVAEFYEVEEFIIRKVPISVFGFGSWEIYKILASMAKTKNIYMLRYYY
jgi:hypothetical protein